MGYQVTDLTQGKQPWEKEFIDFQFDGKNISDFGLVVASSGDRTTFGHSPTFQDEISEVNGLDGQYFWGTKLKTIRRTFALSTDGMTEQDWDAFKRHFRPGKYGKFVEPHLTHRYGYCRVVDVATLSFIPFQKETTVLGQSIKVTIYKGEVQLTLEWDHPFLYAINNVIENTSNPQKYLRDVLNNGTPLPSSWSKSSNMFIGEGAITNSTYNPLQNFSGNKWIRLYIPSNTKTAIDFSVSYTPKFTSYTPNLPTYLSTIADDIVYPGAKDIAYDSIAATDIEDANANVSNLTTVKRIKFTKPNFFYSINRAIKVAYDFYQETSGVGALQDLEERLREEIINEKAINWAITALNIITTETKYGYYDSASGNFLNGQYEVYVVPPILPLVEDTMQTSSVNWFGYFNLFMLYILADRGTNTNFHLDQSGAWTSIDDFFTVNLLSSENKSTVSYGYNSISTNTVTKIQVSEENCGDMMYTEYLKLDGGCGLDLNSGEIQTCYYVRFYSSSNSETMDSVDINYKYTYV